ncbi:MAG TPA: response regulator transcription factor [Thermoanaerobaculia bacterium]
MGREADLDAGKETPVGPPPITILLVGDDPLARSGLAALLAGDPALAVVGQASPADFSGGGDLDDADDGGPSIPARVALWDLGLAPRAALDRLPAAESGPPVLALLANEELAAEAYAAGVRGLLFRDAGPRRLAAALRAVAEGLVVLDGGLADLLAPSAEDDESSRLGDEPAEPLTPREVEVLQLLAQGLSNKQIAARLAISDHTAKFHVAAILGKLGAEGRTDAVVRAARAGLILL